MNATQTLIIDLIPSQGSSVTACVSTSQLSIGSQPSVLTRFTKNNLIRCTLGAALVSVIDIILRALGPGWTYVLLGGICLLVLPLLYLVMKIGPANRAKRQTTIAARVRLG